MLYKAFHLQESDKSRREIRRQRSISHGQHCQLLASPPELRDNQAWWVAGDKLHRLWTVLKPAILRKNFCWVLNAEIWSDSRQRTSARILGALLSPLFTRSAMKADSVMSYSLSGFCLFVLGKQFLGTLGVPVRELGVIVLLISEASKELGRQYCACWYISTASTAFLSCDSPAQCHLLCDPGSHPGS